MARMRTIKPEYWADEDLADLPRDARLLYIGLWNLADEHARLRGDPRYVKGQLFPYDDDLSAAKVDVLINALAVAGRVVRYRKGGGQYMFLPKLAKHQRLEAEKVPSRLPSPEESDPDPPAPKAEVCTDESESRANKSALKHVAGSREHVAGVPPTAGALARRPDDADTAQTLIGEWIDNCRKRPPNNVIGQVGKQIRAMLAEGIDPTDVRRGFAEWHRKGIHPSALPSVVNEVMNAAPQGKSSTTDQRVNQALVLAEKYAREDVS
jgi:hypothetical protein